jgi:outer membrane receptor for ferrienterochelin and colicin
MPNWHATTQTSWVGERERSAADTRSNIDDYTLVNLSLGCQCFTPELNLSVTVKNVFDDNAFEPSPYDVQPAYPGDYPLEGRAAYFSADYSF